MAIPDPIVSVRVPPTMKARLELIASANGTTVSHAINTALDACYKPSELKRRQANALRKSAEQLERRRPRR